MGILERALKKHADALRDDGHRKTEHAQQRRMVERRGVAGSVNENREKWANQQIDEKSIVKRGLAPAEKQSKSIEEQFLRIKRPVLRNVYGDAANIDHSQKLVMVTSALPGEGKTFCSWNLAVSVSKSKDRPVILIDADARKPKLSRDLEDADRLGFLDLIERDDLTIDDVLIQTNYNQLRIIPSGKPRDLSSELFFSDRTKDIMAQLAARVPNGLVIFDSSPLLLTNESKILSGFVGQVVLIVAAGTTGQQSVSEAIDMIEQDIPVNLVLNKCPSAWNDESYGYGYGYGNA